MQRGRLDKLFETPEDVRRLPSGLPFRNLLHALRYSAVIDNLRDPAVVASTKLRHRVLNTIAKLQGPYTAGKVNFWLQRFTRTQEVAPITLRSNL